MKKAEIDHIQRSRFLESGQKVKKQIDTIVQSINLKYPELAGQIEISNNDNLITSQYSGNGAIMKYMSILINHKILA